MDISHLRLKVRELSLQRCDLETRLLMHERFVKGSLLYVRPRCGKRNCRCWESEKQRHGPVLYLSIRIRGKGRTVYVPKAWAEKTRGLVEQARSYRKARKQWLKIQQQLWKIFMEMEQLKTQPLPYEPKRKGR